MALKLKWTKEAEGQLDLLIGYLEENWTEKEISNFFKKLETGLNTICQNPEQHKASVRKDGTREYQVSSQTTIFYDFDKTTATILVLWQNKMNPKDLK